MYPVYVWGDLGWLLSFAAFAGILVVAPIMTRLLYIKGREPGALSQLVIETLSAELMTLPILIVSFGYIPVLALVANVLVAPVIPFAMLFTFIAGVIGWVVPALSILALPASILVAYVVALVEWLSTPEWARFSLSVSSVFAWAWYGVLAVVCWYVWRHRQVDLRAASVVE
jgi:competence protein ComEC